MATQHTSEKADGEAIYSSDALPPLPVPPPPRRNIRKAANDNDDDDDDDDHEDALDSECISPTEAFHKFSSAKSGILATATVAETRSQRLERIRRELDDMEHEGKSTRGHRVHSADMDIANAGESGALVNELQERLNQMMSVNMATRQKELTQIVAGTPSSGAGQPSASATAGPTSACEERLLRIENALGGSGLGLGGSGGHSASILERLRSAEQQLKSVDEKTLSQAAARAKVIRADLEAAAKARSKLNTNAQDTNKIAKLYNQMMELDGFLSGPGPSSGGSNENGSDASPNSTVLCAIIDRLSTCAELHSKSMEFGRDLSSLEHLANDTQVLLSGLEGTLQGLEEGMAKNMKVIQENMEELDKRLS